VELFPLLPVLQEDATRHNEYLKECLETGTYCLSNKPLDARRRAFFEQSVKSFNAADYPSSISPEVLALGCYVFGHVCPVFMIAENKAEDRGEHKDQGNGKNKEGRKT